MNKDLVTPSHNRFQVVSTPVRTTRRRSGRIFNLPSRCGNFIAAARLLTLAVGLTLLASQWVFLPVAGAQQPSGLTISSPSTQGINSLYIVTTAEDFQASLNAANPGDVITLQAGATITGNFLLPKKATGTEAGKKSNWIVIRSSADDALLPEGVRVTPANTEAMAKLVSPNDQPAVRTEPGAHHYRFVGVEFTIAPQVMLNYGIVRFGEGNETNVAQLPHDLEIDRCYIHGHPMADISRGIALNSASSDIMNSRVSEIHGLGFDTQAIAGWNGPGPFRIINNYLEAAGENVMFGGADPKISQLVPSDIEFRRNHCSKPLSWKEGILARPEGVSALGSAAPGNLAPATYYYRITARGRAGYSTTATSGASPEVAASLQPGQSSVSIEWNPVDRATQYRVYRTSDGPEASTRRWTYCTAAGRSFIDSGNSEGAGDSTPPDFGTLWSVKNLFELKNARRVVIDGNLFENNWVDSQSGFAIQFTVRNQDGKANWSTVEDITFTDNIVRHTAAGMNILGRDNSYPSEQVQRVDIIGNLFYDVGGAQWGGNGRFLQITETVGVMVDHNTILHTGNIISAYGVPNQGFVFRNNIAPHNEYGIIGDGSGVGNVTLDRYFPGSLLKKNVIIGAQTSRYPTKNFYPATLEEVGFMDRGTGNYRLADTSQYKRAGTKNKDIGADFVMIDLTARQAAEGMP